MADFISFAVASFYFSRFSSAKSHVKSQKPPKSLKQKEIEFEF
jgi:hypothetical protein